MRVVVLNGLMGKGKPYPIMGGEQDLPDDIAIDLISRGLAEPATPEDKAEKAIITEKKTISKRTKKSVK